MEKQNFPEKQAWGTWEELLLACAVHRYGTGSWNSVAVELQKRSSTLHHLLTPQSCEQKYHDLNRRFSQKEDVPEPNEDENNTTEDASTTRIIPWLDELRKLRVAELRREVERYDLSIVSLQSKVKKLTEEREQSSRDDEKVTEKPDPDRTVDKCADQKEEEKDHCCERENTSVQKVTVKAVPGEDSDREYRSCNESNSTDPECEVPKTGAGEAEKQPEAVEPAAGGSEPAGESIRPAVEDSFNGSSDTVARGSAAASPVRESEKRNSERGAGDSAEIWESGAESKEEGVKESNSDVQSSASLPRKKGNVPRTEEQSPAVKRSPISSQPLVDLLEILGTHRFGSIFEHRLESQETPGYQSLIRQHIDLETIRTRLEEGWYSGGDSKFFRDLLLLFNNAIVFFPKKSSESVAAIELRHIVLKEMGCRTVRQEPVAKEQKSVPPGPPCIKSDPEPSDSLLLKPKISVPLTACRKRSSITAKALASSSGPEKKREQTSTLNDEKPVVDWKQHDKSAGKVEEYRTTKKRTRERFQANSRNSNKNSPKGRSNPSMNKNSDATPNNGFSSRGSQSENSESKPEKGTRNTTINAYEKKKGAANFLNRMKRGSSSNGSPLLETLKGSDNVKGGAEQRKNSNGNGNGKSDSRKEQASRKVSGGRKAKEQGSPAKRSVGRPPKKSSTPSPAVPAKRGREAGETETGFHRQSKKRSRK